MNISIGPGEAYDRLTILQIKLREIKDPEKLENIDREYVSLSSSILGYCAQIEMAPPAELVEALKSVNERLWKVEDELRHHEKNKSFGDEFVKLARKVYYLNDERAEIKREINLKMNSEFIEEKSYNPYK
jgi:hypothetical protein